MNKDTIAAIATAPGIGAISVIRISGNDAFPIAQKIFSKPLGDIPSHTACYGNILASNGSVIDNVLLLLMRNPKSYTGEDTVEISCHGGSLIPQTVLLRIFEEGARAAQPGEFSLRAFLNGKIDLAQAEAVQDLIAAKNDLAMNHARNQLQGALSDKIAQFQTELTHIAAILEAWVDFPEEDLAFAQFDELIIRLEVILQRMESLQRTFHEGKVLHEGLTLCLIGSPNVGKSSLMNALLGKERAIVTDIAGTTRDLLEDDLRLGTFHFKLIDTAGIRETTEVIEKEGIRRSHEAMHNADIVLLLLDASREMHREDLQLLAAAPKEKTIVIWNKSDIGKGIKEIQGLSISAMHKQGLHQIHEAITTLIWEKGPPAKDEVLITKLRHYQALTNAIGSCRCVIQGLRHNVSAEFVASDMRSTLNELGTIIGTNVTEDILTAIFSQFCLGK